MNIKTFDLNLLRVFSAVYEERNVSRAAEVSNLSQPAMSNALLRLRRACSDQLFVRTSKGMEPTALADELIGAVRQALDILQSSFERPEGFDPARSERTFRLLMSDAGESAILPPLVSRTSRVAPGIRIEALRHPHDNYAELLQRGTADLAIGNLAFLNAGFFQQKLFEDPYCCIVRKKHPVIKGSVTLKQFLEVQHVAVSTGNADALVDRALARLRNKRDIRLKATHYHVASDIVESTDLIATVPRNSAVRLKSLQVLPVPVAIAPAAVRQFWHRRSHKDLASQWLRSLISSIEFVVDEPDIATKRAMSR